MKKIIFIIVICAFAFSCGHDSEEPVIKPGPVDNPAIRLYFSESIIQRIGIIDLSTTGSFSTLLDYENNNLGIPAGIAVNQVSKRLYIAEQDAAVIHRINLDSTLYRIVYDSDNGVSNPTSVAIDTIGKKLYWANSGTGQLMVGDLFGSVDPVTLFGGEPVIQNCYGIAIDNKSNKIYFSDNLLRQISVGNLDGTGMPTILFDENNTDNIGCPSSLVLSSDKLYWADDCFNNILRAGIVSTEKPVALFGEEDGISLPAGLDIDKAAKKIYWSETDGSVIARGNLDGTGEREIILENIQANSISLEFP
jgi:sugar lactone lactonase YvrE